MERRLARAKSTRGLLAAVMTVATLGLAGTPVGAAPEGAKKLESFPGTCEGRTVDFVVIATGNGTYTPAFALGTNGVFVPQAFAIWGSFTPGDGGPVGYFSEDASKHNTGPGAVTCTFDATFPLFGGIGRIEGTVIGVFRGGAER